MAKKVGLPDFVKSRYDNHLVDEISSRSKTTIIRKIPIEKIVPNLLQPRKNFTDLKELTESIEEKGILEPLIVRPKGGKFEIIAGERRYRAAKNAGLNEVPCVEYDVPDNEALEISIVENIQRKDLNVYEKAFSLKSLSDIYGYTHEEIALKLSKSRVTVSELIRLTDLPEEVLNLCRDANITSKSFLLQLVKLNNIDEMIHVIEEYKKNPFSRDEVKDLRKNKKNNFKNNLNISKPLKFKFISDDKKIRIDFKIKDDIPNENSMESIIDILEKLIIDIKKGNIEDFKV